MNRTFSTGLAVVGALFAAASADAQSNYQLFGNASIVSPGNGSDHAVRAISTASASDLFGGIRFTLPAGSTVNGLETLATDYMVVAGDCGGGSPRFSVRVDMDGDGQDTAADKTIFVYIGPAPNFTDCPTGWQSTGNLLDDEDLRVDTSQVGGTFYDTWEHAQQLVGDKAILSVRLVVDGYWVVDPQTFDFDNVNVDGTIYTFEPLVTPTKQACKNLGWRNLFRPDGTPFKNQGDCIQFVNTGQ